MARSDPLKPRKAPSQRRSKDTVDAILDGAARVFGRHGHARGTTNRIAAAAGVSIGSLYEYFPNKEAILVALAERHLERMLAEVAERLDEARESARGLAPFLRRLVVAMLDVHERNPSLHRVVFSEAPHPPALHACVLQMEEGLAHSVEAWLRASDEALHRDPDRAAHLVVQTVEALTHRYAHHHTIHDLAREDFVEEVVSLLEGYLRGEAGRRP